jgi:hypothetical protein
MSGHFSIEAALAGPLQFTFVLTPTVNIVTTVTGDARNNASVQIMNGTLPVWSGAMTQSFPQTATTYDLILGTITIKSGCTFNLTIPTTSQNGFVVMQAMITSGGSTAPFGAIVASWPLTSAA